VNDAMVKILVMRQKKNSCRKPCECPDSRSCKRAQLLGQPDQQGSVDPIEIEWKRKDHTTLKVQLSGQEILGEQGQLDAYEVITEDVTKQRQLEDRLRQQAARDPLTGLANYRHLAEVLAMEVKRSERTGREFALLLFDLDGLKQINDRYGHLTGSHAICRVADVLSFCRDTDTAARYGGTSLRWSCRKQASRRPTRWRNVSVKALPMTGWDRRFPSALALQFIPMTVKESKPSYGRQTWLCMR